MKDAKDFYDAYDIPRPQKLLPREEVLFDKLNSTQKDFQVQIKNQQEKITELKQKLFTFDATKISIIGGIAGLTMAIILSIGGEIANSEKRALHEENKLLKKENIYLKNSDVGKLAIENQKLREENKKQKEELQKYNCFWKACIK